jgi:hypothetical protein
MHLSYKCPNCGRHHTNIHSRFAGKRIRCECGTVAKLVSKPVPESTSLAEPKQKKFYLVRNSDFFGPYDLDQLKQAAAKGTLSINDRLAETKQGPIFEAGTLAELKGSAFQNSKHRNNTVEVVTGVKIKKDIFGGKTLEYQCPKCQVFLSTGEEFAKGSVSTCPSCKTLHRSNPIDLAQQPEQQTAVRGEWLSAWASRMWKVGDLSPVFLRLLPVLPALAFFMYASREAGTQGRFLAGCCLMLSTLLAVMLLANRYLRNLSGVVLAICGAVSLVVFVTWFFLGAYAYLEALESIKNESQIVRENRFIELISWDKVPIPDKSVPLARLSVLPASIAGGVIFMLFGLFLDAMMMMPPITVAQGFDLNKDGTNDLYLLHQTKAGKAEASSKIYYIVFFAIGFMCVLGFHCFRFENVGVLFY